MHDFKAIAVREHCRAEAGFRHDLEIAFNGDLARLKAERADELVNTHRSIEPPFFAVNDQFHDAPPFALR